MNNIKYIFVIEFLKNKQPHRKIMFHIFFIVKVHICIQAKKKKVIQGVLITEMSSRSL